MSLSPEFLLRLSSTTDYAELRAIFAELAAHAESSANNPQLADAIDQAIQRMIEERTRDDRELTQVRSQYESFKADNRGVVGWFKRHIPFTETRRQESTHKGEVANQAAEILADNLVIARAQMIKERLLPAARRRLGQRISDWQTQWESQRPQLSSAGAFLSRLSAELLPSQNFVDELQRDIEAFAAAEFREADDRRRRDEDLAAARRELDSLKQEIAAKATLKRAGLKTVVDTAIVELANKDPEFRRDGEQLDQLQSGLHRLTESRTNLTKLAATVGQVSSVAKQLHALPDQIQESRQAIAQIDAEKVAAEQASAMKSAVIPERQARLGDAERAAEQATQVLTSFQSDYDAYLAQRSAEKSLPVAAEKEPAAPIEQQFQTARIAVEQAQSRRREATAAIETARGELTQAQATVKVVADKLVAANQKLNELEKKDPQLRGELRDHSDRGQREFALVAAAFATYLANQQTLRNLIPNIRLDEFAAGTFGWLSANGLERALGAALLNFGQDLSRHLQAVTILERLGEWHDSQKKTLDQEQARTVGRRESIWKRRCQEILGIPLAEEACAAGMPVRDTPRI